MSTISPKTFPAHSAERNSLDASRSESTPDPWPVVAAASLLSGACVAPYDPRWFGFDPTQRETTRGESFRTAPPSLGGGIPQQGDAVWRERGVKPLAGYSRGEATAPDRSKTLPFVSQSVSQADTDVVASPDSRTGDTDGHTPENTGFANRLASPMRGWLASIGHGPFGLWQRWRRWREVSRSIAALSQLDDRTLRDIGIHHRVQIHDRVRFER